MFKINFVAAQTSSASWRKALLSRWPTRIDVHATCDGVTALGFAARAGDVELVKQFLCMGANIERGDVVRKETPLCLAARHGHDDVMQVLMASGANVDCGYAGGTLLHWAALNWIMHSSNERRVEALLAAGASVHKATVSCNSALIVAARGGHLASVNALLRAPGGRDYLNCCAVSGATPLLSSIVCGRTNVAVALIRAGANVDAADKQRETPLHAAIRRGDIKLVRLLIAAGAKLDKRDNARRLPIKQAMLDRRADIVAALIAGGAKTSAKLVRSARRHLPNRWDSDSGRVLRLLTTAAGVASHRRATKAIERARAAIARARTVPLFRDRIVDICIGLQSLGISALELVAIVDHALPGVAALSLALKWQLVTAVKHFRSN